MDDEAKITDLTNSMSDLDAMRQRTDYVSIAAQTAANTTKLDRIIQDRDQARAEDKADHNATMNRLWAIFLLVLGTLLTVVATLGVAHYRGSRAEKAGEAAVSSADKVEKFIQETKEKVEEGGRKADAAYREANNFGKREHELQDKQDKQDDRLDLLESPDVKVDDN
jgi:hypothetical protein